MFRNHNGVECHGCGLDGEGTTVDRRRTAIVEGVSRIRAFPPPARPRAPRPSSLVTGPDSDRDGVHQCPRISSLTFPNIFSRRHHKDAPQPLFIMSAAEAACLWPRKFTSFVQQRSCSSRLPHCTSSIFTHNILYHD